MIQYQRHNLQYNLNNAIATKDSGMAVDIVMHEINELVLDFPTEVTNVLIDAGIVLPKSPTHKQLALAIKNNFADNSKVETGITTLIMNRHKDPHIGADPGVYDKLYPVPFLNLNGSEVKDVPVALQISTGIKSVTPTVKDVNLVASLEQKMRQRGMSIPTSPIKIIGGAVAIAILVVAVVFAYKKITQVTSSEASLEGQPALA